MRSERSIFNFSTFKKIFPLKKKIVVFFALSCMATNGFTINAIDAGRSSFVLAIAVSCHNIISNTFKRCNDSLVVLSNKILNDIQENLFLSQSANGNHCGNKKSNNKSKDSATSNNNEIALYANTFSNIKKMIGCSCDKLCSNFMLTAKRFQLYINCKTLQQDLEHKVIFLAFIIFIFVLRRRKIFIDICYILKNKNLGI